MKLDTIKKVHQFVDELGALEFVFITDNIITYKTPIPIMINGYLKFYEVLFFMEDCSTFYRMDSYKAFLSSLEIFEVRRICEELGTLSFETIYHRKYKSDIILNSEEDVLDSMQPEQIEGDLETLLKEELAKEDYEEAGKIRDQIKNKK